MNEQHAERVFIKPPTTNEAELQDWCQDVAASITNQFAEQAPTTDEPPTGGVSTSTEEITEDDWTGLIAAVTETLMSMHLGQFIVVEYETEAEVQPYAQAAVSNSGFACEIVSEQYLPGDTWPIDDAALGRHGWALPDDASSNWMYQAQNGALAARTMVDGLRFGRLCVDPFRFSWHVGTFPPQGGGEDVDTHASAAA